MGWQGSAKKGSDDEFFAVDDGWGQGGWGREKSTSDPIFALRIQRCVEARKIDVGPHFCLLGKFALGFCDFEEGWVELDEGGVDGSVLFVAGVATGGFGDEGSGGF